MRIVVRSEHDITVVNRCLSERPECGYMVEITKYRAPRTWSQQKLLHALIGELAEFCGETPARMKTTIKGLEFWPTEVVERFGIEQELPKSEACLSKEEEEMVITHIYQLGDFVDGFAWQDVAP